MTFVEELTRDVDAMRAQGKSVEEITEFVDRQVAEWNAKTFEAMRMRGMVERALA